MLLYIKTQPRTALFTWHGVFTLRERRCMWPFLIWGQYPSFIHYDGTITHLTNSMPIPSFSSVLQQIKASVLGFLKYYLFIVELSFLQCVMLLRPAEGTKKYHSDVDDSCHRFVADLWHLWNGLMCLGAVSLFATRRHTWTGFRFIGWECHKTRTTGLHKSDHSESFVKHRLQSF